MFKGGVCWLRGLCFYPPLRCRFLRLLDKLYREAVLREKLFLEWWVIFYACILSVTLLHVSVLVVIAITTSCCSVA